MGRPGRTTLELFDAQVKKRGDAVALRHASGATWTTTSWRGWDEEARAVAAAMIARGVAAKDRVAMPMRTRREALIATTAIQMAGAIAVPIHPTLPRDQIDLIVRDAGARVRLVEDRDSLAVSMLDERGATLAWDDLIREGREALGRDAEIVDARARAVTPKDAAAILYTSGTSGEPKGVEISHAAFVFEVDALSELFGLGPSDEQLLFLPIAHIFGQILVVAAMRVGASTIVGTSMLHVLDDAEQTHPTFFGSVPRVFEKLHATVRAKVKEAGRAQEAIFEWAMDVGRKRSSLVRAGREVPLTLEVQHRYADKLVFSKLRARFGGRLRFALSGAAPLDAWLAEWFHAAGVPVYEGYGLTETTAATNVNHPQALQIGSVGRAVPGVEVKIDGGAEEGEVLLRGPNLMTGYWNRPDETKEAIDADGWLHTGDIGRVDDAGFLRITDRKKDLLVTAGGKNVAPQRIETLLARSPLVQRAVVLGDRRPYLVALIVPDFEAIRALEAEPALAGLEASLLAQHARVRQMLQAIVDETNAQLASFETIKRFAILAKDLSIDEGELTPTSKVRRRRVEEKHRDALARLYE